MIVGGEVLTGRGGAITPVVVDVAGALEPLGLAAVSVTCSVWPTSASTGT